MAGLQDFISSITKLTRMPSTPLSPSNRFSLRPRHDARVGVCWAFLPLFFIWILLRTPTERCAFAHGIEELKYRTLREM